MWSIYNTKPLWKDEMLEIKIRVDLVVGREIPWTEGQSVTGLTIIHRHTHFTLTPTENLVSLINPYCVSVDCGRNQSAPEDTHSNTGRTCKLHKEMPQPQDEPELGPSCCEMTHRATTWRKWIDRNECLQGYHDLQYMHYHWQSNNYMNSTLSKTFHQLVLLFCLFSNCPFQSVRQQIEIQP